MNFSLDIGGTNVKFAIINDDYEIIKKEILPTPETYEMLLELIKNKYHEYDAKGNIHMSCPSAYSYELKQIIGSSALEYIIGKDIVNDLGDVATVIIENDANCALLGELTTGAAKDCNSAALFTIGTGIGGATYVNGALLKGASGISSEFGYMLIDNQLETNHYKSLGGKASIGELANRCNLIDPSIKSGKDVFNNLDNEKVYAEVKKSLTYLAIGIINVQYTIDPETIIIGGAVSENETFMKMLKETLDEVLATRPLYVIKPKVTPALCHNDAQLIGAVKNAK